MLASSRVVYFRSPLSAVWFNLSLFIIGLLFIVGWGGAGLGASEQGIVDPVKAAEVRGASDMYRGIGVETNDPFENFRKSRSGVFIQKLKDRDELLTKIKKINGQWINNHQ